MLIEFDKYQPNSLRRGRVEALQKDLSDAFTVFANRFSDPKIITINDFIAFWNATQIKLIIHLRCEDQDEEEYFHVIDKILISDYFIKGSEYKKIYCLLCLYFFAYSIDTNGDCNPRYIHVNPEFLTKLTAFMRENIEHSKQLFMKLIKKIKGLFIYGIKLGVRDPLIKKNGETYARYPKNARKLTRDNYSPAILEIKEALPALQNTVRSYQQAKDNLFHDSKGEKLLSYKKQMNFDKNVGKRLRQILNSYDSEVTYVQQDMKHIPEQPIDNQQ